MKWLLNLLPVNTTAIFWCIIVSFCLGAASGGEIAWKVQGWRLESVQAKFDGFVATTKTLGEAAQKESDLKKVRDKLDKEKADEQNKRAIDSLIADNKRLRNARSSSNFVPAFLPGSTDTSRTCFDRAELESAIRGLDQGVQGILDKGDKAIIDLNTSKLWAKQ